MNDVDLIKVKNIIDMAFTFSAMGRVFQKESKKKIVQELDASFKRLASVHDRAEFEALHLQFCLWFVSNVRTAQKRLTNNKIKRSRNASYGHAAKIFDIAIKVYVYYCHLPTPESAVTLLPLLHGAVDTPIMENLIAMFHADGIRADTIEAVSAVEYAALQELVTKHIAGEFNGLILPVQYDDIMWSRLNR